MENENTITILSRDEIANLSRRLSIALAVRCCQRIKHFYKCAWPTAPSEYIKAIETAITQAIYYCTMNNDFNFTEVSNIYSELVKAQSSLPYGEISRVVAQTVCIVTNRTIEAVIFSFYADNDLENAIKCPSTNNYYNIAANEEEHRVHTDAFNIVQNLSKLFNKQELLFVHPFCHESLNKEMCNDITELLKIDKIPWPKDTPVTDDFFKRDLWPDGEPRWPDIEPLIKK